MNYFLSAVDQDVFRTLFIRESQFNDRQKQSNISDVFYWNWRQALSEIKRGAVYKYFFVFQGGYLEHIFTSAAKEASGILFVEPWQK